VCDPSADVLGEFTVPVNEANLSSCEITFEVATKEACLPSADANCGLSVGGQDIDLSALHSDAPIVRQFGDYTYKFQVCGPVAASAGAGCAGVPADAQAFQFANGRCVTALSDWDDSVQWKLINANNASEGIMYTVANGPECDDQGIKVKRVVNWKFVCDPSADVLGEFTVPVNEANLSSCEITFEVATKEACLPSASGGPDDDDDDDDEHDAKPHHGGGGGGGLSTGWVVVICVAALAALGACAFLARRKAATGHGGAVDAGAVLVDRTSSDAPAGGDDESFYSQM
jgi:hypothetical protein